MAPATKSEVTEAELARKAEMLAAKEREAANDAKKSQGPIAQFFAEINAALDEVNAGFDERRKAQRELAAKDLTPSLVEDAKAVAAHVEDQYGLATQTIRDSKGKSSAEREKARLAADAYTNGAVAYLANLAEKNPALYAATMMSWEEAAAQEDADRREAASV